MMTLTPKSILNDAIDPTQLKRALVIKLRHHGDVLLASPVLSCLQAVAPNCEIDALVFADTAPMLSEHPALHALHSLDRHAKKRGLLAQLQHEWALLKVLRARRYDLVVHLTDHPRGAWLTQLLGPRWAVAPQRNKGSKWLQKYWRRVFSHHYKTVGGGRRHTVDTHLDALRRLGLQVSGEATKLCLRPGSAAEASVSAHLAPLAGRPFIHFHPASRWFFKCWPVAQSAALLANLVAEGHRVVLTAAPDAREAEMLAAILQQAAVPPERVLDLGGRLSLKELAAVSAQAQLFIGVDSAPMHIAAAVATPCVALFGPSGDREWGPWQVAHEIVTTQHPCRPCGQDGCGGGKVSACLTELPVSQVLAAVRRVLSQAA